MTASELFAPHTGDHCAEPVSPAVAVIRYLCRLVRQWRRRKAVPAVAAAGAATALLAGRYPCCFHCHAGSPCEPRDSHPEPCAEGCNEVPTGIIRFDGVLSDKMLSEVREQWNAWHDELPAPRTAQQHADAMHAGYANAVDRLRREAGLPTVGQMHAMRAGSPPWLFPPLDEPSHAEPQPRGPVHDTRMDVYAPHCAPDVPAYGQAPQLVVAPELARQVIA